MLNLRLNIKLNMLIKLLLFSSIEFRKWAKLYFYLRLGRLSTFHYFQLSELASHRDQGFSLLAI